MHHRKRASVVVASLVPVLCLGLAPALALANEADPLADAIRGLDTVFVLVSAFLVFFMQAGFSIVEAGFTRAKNAVNIIMKNFADYCLASLLYFALGYALMFGTDFGGIIGGSGFLLYGAENPTGLPLAAFWLFQAAFCGTTATIVSGAVAERMKFTSYLLGTAFITALVYPIVGHWGWGGGWLGSAGFHDFAGSSIVHACGGSAALVAAWLVGPRRGKYTKDGVPLAIPGHNIPLAALGVFILWFGWFGFNPGSNLAVGDGSAIGHIAMTTNLAAAAGALVAMLTIWLHNGKPDLSMMMNGALAGLVGITAGCSCVSAMGSIIIGAVAGLLVVYGVLLIDRMGVDDPVGAVSVHGINGIWGTLAVGLFGRTELQSLLVSNGFFVDCSVKQLGVQALGTGSIVGFSLLTMGGFYFLLSKTVGLRVSPVEESRGLDIDEHGMEAYAGFQIFINQ